MPYKDPVKQRAAQAAHYLANKEQYKKRASLQKRAAYDKVSEIKESSPCTDCKKFYPFYVMHFDHISDNKLLNVAKLVRTRSWATVLSEIEKCELVCANCHAERTWTRSMLKRQV